MRFLITGHTGFKGAWLSLLLARRGHSVSGISLDPEPGSLFEVAHVDDVVEVDIRADIRDATAVRAELRAAQPTVIIHMAAQPLVREAHRRPRWTLESNVLGTLNVLEAASEVDSVAGLVVVTTDKVYRNDGHGHGYREDDPLGGRDPYSASKAMADILTQSWAASFPGVATAIARAGNVIGGGDVCAERLVPDVVAALRQGRAPVLRHPAAIRPWQHVLDCLEGYLTLVEALVAGDPVVSSGSAWNFGPPEGNLVSVAEVTTKIMREWGRGDGVVDTGSAEFHEEAVLSLTTQKARGALAWRDSLDLDRSIQWTTDWYRGVDGGRSPRDITEQQVGEFEAIRRKAGRV